MDAIDESCRLLASFMFPLLESCTVSYSISPGNEWIELLKYMLDIDWMLKAFIALLDVVASVLQVCHSTHSPVELFKLEEEGVYVAGKSRK